MHSQFTVVSNHPSAEGKLITVTRNRNNYLEQRRPKQACTSLFGFHCGLNNLVRVAHNRKGRDVAMQSQALFSAVLPNPQLSVRSHSMGDV